ncbi:hypothetical protein J1N35_045696 [Gossypium stocksii]|uniref:MORF/ORRM1/DAG-like MORF domain-containing protein n=1 Tax=Gossypium stocksii TaxID=47602 RepID=A0A9D3UBM7_9ROSI|nr:hypothetical protein J1N35_045696 [Gossypium stocksii]
MACLNAGRSLSTLLSRALTASSSSFPSHSRLTVALLNKTPIFIPEATKILSRTKTSGSGYLPLNDPSPNCSSPRPSVLLDESYYDHWLIILEFPECPKPLEEEMIDAYVKTLASVVGSEEEAKKRIYSVCTTRYTGFRNFFSVDLIDELRARNSYLVSAGFYQLGVGSEIVIMQVGVPNSSHRVGGCGDDELWLITVEFGEEPSLKEKIDFYVKTLASVVGSEEEAKRRIYAVGGRLMWYIEFRAVMSEEMAYELQGLPLVEGVYRDSLEVYNEDVDGGHLLVDGKVVLRPTSKERSLLPLVRLVVDQILNDMYIRKMDETETKD